MQSYNIAVTGVGGGVGQSVIKSLYETGYNIIGLDGEILGTGLYAVPKAYKIPYSRDEAFIPALLDICKTEQCSLLFPGLDAELMPLSLNRHRFEEIGTRVVVSDPSVIEVSDNKMATYEQLTPHGIAVPKTINLDSYLKDKVELQWPLIIKQKVGGARSKNVFLVKNQQDWDNFLVKHEKEASSFIVQEYIEGDEYTCGSVNLDGTCKGVIVMRRILRDGDTYKCFVEQNPLIEETVRKVVQAIKPFGACNIQLRMKDGVPYVFEINARCSGTTASRTACGFNEPKMIADYLLQGIQPAFTILPKTVLRYWKELIVENESISEFSAKGVFEKNNFTQL